MTSINSNANGNQLKRKWFQSEISESLFNISQIKFENNDKNDENYVIKKCCNKNHILKLSVGQQKEIINYFK